MDEVGRQFNANQLIVAEVLQSAEAMKFAVAHLEPHMERTDAALRGRILLATVKGDVHDIGKNLVEIILSNNGYSVINLGIKVAAQELIAGYREHQPDIIGPDFRAAGIAAPVLVGGAALSNRFTRLRIAPEYGGLVAYSPDAMSGLALANTIQDADERERLLARILPAATDLRLHVLEDFDLDEIFGYINPQMLYVRHLGYRGRFWDALRAEEPKAVELRQQVQRVEDMMLSRSDIGASAVFKFFPCRSEGQWLIVYEPDGKAELERFYLHGSRNARDFAWPTTRGRPARVRNDYLAMFTTTVGPGSGIVRTVEERGQVPGFAHVASPGHRIGGGFCGVAPQADPHHVEHRRTVGLKVNGEDELRDLFRANYHGKRFSFGYPACPRLEDQEKLFSLLDVTASIGVELTDGYMMDPEGSVSAV
ncbi:Methionine synthase, partial [Geodia barretti]